MQSLAQSCADCHESLIRHAARDTFPNGEGLNAAGDRWCIFTIYLCLPPGKGSVVRNALRAPEHDVFLMSFPYGKHHAHRRDCCQVKEQSLSHLR